ncbi:MAG: ABC transporter permease [Pseudomonadota bacterium]
MNPQSEIRNPKWYMTGFIGNIGRQTIKSVDHFLGLFAFAFRMLTLLFRRHKEGRKMLYRTTVKQSYFTAIQALPIVIFIALLVGSVVIIQFFGYGKFVEDANVLSDLIVILIIREMGPLFVAIIVILRSAIAVTIETGYMSILKEMDSIEMMGLDPVRVVGLPRLLGITTAMLCLFWVFDTVAIFGGYAVAWTATSIPLDNFLGGVGKSITPTDIIVPIIKAFLFGVIISTNCLYRGLNVKHAITEIPPTSSKAAVECLLYCLFVNILVSVIFYL